MRDRTDDRRVTECSARGLGAIALGCALAACADDPASPAPSGDAATRPNVVLVSIDSLRADHLGCYGYERDTSPHLDQLADEGVLFENVVAESSWTLPTHASIFTGLTGRVHEVGYERQRLGESFRTLAEILAEDGYRTRAIWSGPYLHPVFGLQQGFAPDDYEGVLDGPTASSWEEVDASHKASHASVTSPEVARKGIEFLEQAGEVPFFLFLHFFDVHYDFIPPEEDWRRFDPDYDGDLTSERFKANKAIHADMDPRDLAHLLALYDGEILFTDRHIGRVFDALERLGLDDETLVIVTSDHGDEFFEHGGKGHFQHLFDEVVMVPLLMKLPGRLAPGRRVPTQVRHIDIMPTILDVVGVEAPRRILGESLLRWASVGSAPPDTDLPAVSRLFGREDRELTTLRTREWKLAVVEDDGGPRATFYDLVEDPGEQSPLGGRRFRERVDTAYEQLLQLQRREERLRERWQGADDGEDVSVPGWLDDQLRELGYVR